MKNSKVNKTEETVEQLSGKVISVHKSTSCIDVLNVFHSDNKLYAIPVVNKKNNPVGIVVRHAYTDLFSKQFAKELNGKKSISEMMDKSPIIVDCNTSLDDISRIILDAGVEHMVSGFIITKDEQYIGMANGYDLLKELTKRKQEHLFSLAHYDQLTGLPNRTLLLDRLKQAISVSKRGGRKVALLFIDLDGFKFVNDTYGHAVGDALLKEVAQRLRDCLRDGDTAARLGGDEFVVVLLESDSIKSSAAAKRILEAIRVNYEIETLLIDSISASIGVAEFPAHGANEDQLLSAADHAMYTSKHGGKNRITIAPPLSATEFPLLDAERHTAKAE